MRATSILVALALLLAPGLSHANRKSSFKKNEFKLEYRGTLESFASGSEQDALAELIELESRSGEEAGGDLQPLWKAKLSVVRDLLGAGPELLVPVTQLHERAYVEYLERGSHSLAAHSRTMAMELAEIYADRVKDEHGRRMASALMTSLAGYMQAAFVDPTASSLYRRAASLDPNNVAARLGLAGILERHGDYDEAIPILREAVRVSPASSESRLRLAIQLIRVEELEEAEQLLRDLVEGPAVAPRWVRSLAFQELTILLIDSSEVEQAATLVEIAQRELPGDPTLPILLAFASDRAGHRSSKSALSSALGEAGSNHAPSPRYRYSQMPRQELEAVRATLRGETAAQLSTLAAALSDRAGGSTGSR